MFWVNLSIWILEDVDDRLAMWKMNMPILDLGIHDFVMKVSY